MPYARADQWWSLSGRLLSFLLPSGSLVASGAALLPSLTVGVATAAVHTASLHGFQLRRRTLERLHPGWPGGKSGRTSGRQAGERLPPARLEACATCLADPDTPDCRSAGSGTLRQIAEQNRVILDSVSEGLAGLDLQQNITFFNQAACRLTGWPEAGAVGLPRHHVLGELAAGCLYPSGAGAGAGAGGEEAGIDCSSGCCSPGNEAWLCRRDGSKVPVEFSVSPIHEHNQLTGWVLLFRDIRERRQAEETRKLAAAVLEWSAQAIMVTDPEGRITTVNPAFSRLTGHEAAGVVGQPSSLLRSGQHEDAFYRQQQVVLERDGSWRGETWNRRQDGSLFVAWVSITRIRDDSGKGSHDVAFYFDITDRKQHEEQIIAEANHDALTGLPNRRLFGQTLATSLPADAAAGAGGSGAVMLVDLDGFKAVNDTWGHEAGDALLTELAGRMQKVVRAGDMVARLGGDEFTILLHGVSVLTAQTIAGKILYQLSQPVDWHGQSLAVSGSIGISLFPADGRSADLVIAAADRAMYAVKKGGKHGFMLASDLVPDFVPERADMRDAGRDSRWKGGSGPPVLRACVRPGCAASEASALHHAFEHREFSLVYQPVVDVRSLSVSGFEALLRWHRCDGSVVLPHTLLPMIRRQGLSERLAGWLAGEAARQLACWSPRHSRPLVVTINLDLDSLLLPDLCGLLAAPLIQQGLSPASLELDIPEDVYGRLEARKILADLHSSGFHLALDEFSGGLTVLGELASRPPRRVKISRTILASLSDGSPVAATLLGSLAAMTDSLGIELLAKGVETPGQLEATLRARCHALQGFAISHPLEASRTTSFAATFDQAFPLEDVSGLPFLQTFHENIARESQARENREILQDPGGCR